MKRSWAAGTTVLAPIAWAAWHAKRWSALKDRRLVVGIASALAVTALWYWHADVLFHRTGLGLAISRDIVRAHGGDLGLRRSPGAGSTFIVKLPATAAPPDGIDATHEGIAP